MQSNAGPIFYYKYELFLMAQHLNDYKIASDYIIHLFYHPYHTSFYIFICIIDQVPY